MLKYNLEVSAGRTTTRPAVENPSPNSNSPSAATAPAQENSPHLLEYLAGEARFMFREIRNSGSEIRTSSFWNQASVDFSHVVRTEVLTWDMAKEVGKMFLLGLAAGAVGSFASRRVLASFGMQQVERLAFCQLFSPSSHLGVRALAGLVGMSANASAFSLLTGALSLGQPGRSLVHVAGSTADFSLIHAGNWALHPLMQALPVYFRIPLDVLCGGLLFSGASALRTELFNDAGLSREDVRAHLSGTQLVKNMGFQAGNRAVSTVPPAIMLVQI